MEPGLVSSVKYAPRPADPRPGKVRVVEIIGPAGAGKTTLYQLLNRFPEWISLENFPNVRKAADAPFFVSNGIRLIPRLLRLHRADSRQLTRPEFAWMTILHGWPAILQREAHGNDKTIVLDQGPLYLLAEMRLSGPAYLHHWSAARFWQHLYASWGAVLDMVLWLDAADDVLLDRIRNRQQEHIMKMEPAMAVCEFLDRFRAEYEFILSMLVDKNAGLKVLRVDTGRQGPYEVVNQFLAEIGY